MDASAMGKTSACSTVPFHAMPVSVLVRDLETIGLSFGFYMVASLGLTTTILFSPIIRVLLSYMR